MEATIVAIASGVGTVFNVLLFIDAVRDRWLVGHADPPRPELERVALNQVFEAGAWLAVQGTFFAIAMLSIFGTSDEVKNVAFLLLIAVPIIITIKSASDWFRRKLSMNEAVRESRRNRS